LEFEIADPDIWKSAKKGGRAIAEKKIKEFGETKDLVNNFDEIEKGINELENNFTEEKFYEIKRKSVQLELKSLFTGKYDKQSAVISIFAGVGGKDAEDWAKMLLEMYSKYAQKQDWKTKIIDQTPSSATFEIKGQYAYGYLKNEAGVHRLVRISPFSPEKKRHTSFALVEILPDLPEVDEKEFEIPEEDLKVEFFRSSGPGGQNVNKVETAVRIIHQPTGISVASQVERSQIQNRQRALKILKAKLIKLMGEEKEKELSKLRIKVKPEWGNQIRSYVLNPYKLVKDTRTGAETANIESVLEGNLDIFIENEIE